MDSKRRAIYSYLSTASERRDGRLQRELRVFRPLCVISALSAIVYQFLLVGFSAAAWEILVCACGLLGSIVLLIGCRKGDTPYANQLTWLNAGVVLMWGRFWIEVAGCIQELSGHHTWSGIEFVIRSFELSDLFALVPIGTLIGVTIWILRLDIIFLRLPPTPRD